MEEPVLTKKGDSKKAFTMTTVASFIGGTFSSIILILISPQLAKVALSFGPPEYFALALFGISIVAGVSGSSLLKGVIAGLIGLFIATIVMDLFIGTPRLKFDFLDLLNDVDVILALFGLFLFSEILIR